jgi:hypothetical protein
MKLSSLLLFSFVVFATKQALAAACCGGGFAAPSVIVGDDRAQLTSSFSYTDVVVDNVDSKGLWRQWSAHQSVQSFRFEGAHILSDRWQAGFSLPILQRSYLGQDHSGFGDVAGSVGYEYLTDWDYHPYRPKAVGYLQMTLPTGKSRAESEDGLDSRGNGFTSVGVGTLLTKIITVWDVFSSLEIHRSFSKSVSNAQIQGTLEPGFGGSLGLGGGYNTKSWRFGGAVNWVYEDPINIQSDFPIRSSVERYGTAIASASYMANDEWAGTLSYYDQTLIGNPLNTSLGRGVALQLQKRWAR